MSSQLTPASRLRHTFSTPCACIPASITSRRLGSTATGLMRFCGLGPTHSQDGGVAGGKVRDVLPGLSAVERPFVVRKHGRRVHGMKGDKIIVAFVVLADLPVFPETL